MAGNFARYVNGDRVFWGLLLVYLTTVYFGLMGSGPMNVHMWRQADCLSLTQQYMEGAPLLEPQMHMQMGDGYSSGRTAGEFPGMYYLMAQLWKITGMSYLSYRLFMLFLLVVGIWCFYKALQSLISKEWLVLAITFTLLASPTLLFYGVSFLTDAPAFCLVLMGLYGLLRYAQTSKTWWFYVAMVLMLLAGLIKISSLIAFAFFAGIWGLELMGVQTLSGRKFFKHSWSTLPGFLMVVAGIFAWYDYAKAYNLNHGFKYTYNDIFPIWLLHGDAWWNWVKNIVGDTLLVYFPYPTVVLLAVMWIWNLGSFKRLPLLAWLANLVVVLGGLVYVVLWGPLFAQHDYYYIALLVLFPAIVVPFAWQIDQARLGWWSSNTRRTKRIWLFYAGFSMIYGMQMMHLKTELYDGKIAPLTAPRSFYHTMNWFNWNKRVHWDSYVRLQAVYADLGIGPHDKVISIPDDSFNISLFLMQRKGWTNFVNFENPETLNKALQNGASVLVVADTTWLSKPILQPLLTQPLGTFEHLHLFRIKP